MANFTNPRDVFALVYFTMCKSGFLGLMARQYRPLLTEPRIVGVENTIVRGSALLDSGVAVYMPRVKAERGSARGSSVRGATCPISHSKQFICVFSDLPPQFFRLLEQQFKTESISSYIF